MSPLGNQNIFVRQSFWLKLIILAFGSVVIVAVSPKVLIITCLITVIYISFSPELFKYIWVGFRKLLPFFAGYSLFGIIFQLDIITIGVLCLRIMALMLLTAYFAATLKIFRLMEDFAHFSRNKYLHPILLTTICIILYIREFAQQSMNHGKDNQKEKGTTFYHRIIDVLVTNWNKSGTIESKALAIIQSEYSPIPQLNRYNVLGLVYFTALIIITSL